MSSDATPDIAVIGAGIIGIATAAYLAEAGHAVTFIDRTGICEETSSGNAAAFAFTDVLPLAHKGMMRQLPKWLADPLGPLSIPPAYLPKLLPWLWRFWRAGADGNYETSLAAQAELMRLAETEWMGLMQRSGTQAMLHEDGALELYESDADFQASLPGWAARDRFGIEYRHLSRDPSSPSYQPGLASSFVRGTFVPGWKTVSDPKDSRQGDLAIRGSEGCGVRPRRCRPCPAPARTHRGAAQARAHDHGAAAGHRGRRLVAFPGAAIRRPRAAGDRARL